MRDNRRAGDHQGACQAITEVFALLGKRWSGLIIVTLLDGPARFSSIARLLPAVSERMLSERLSELTAAGLLTREVDQGPPLGVSYQLTSKGESLRPALAELERWGHEQLLAEHPHLRPTNPPRQPKTHATPRTRRVAEDCDVGDQ